MTPRLAEALLVLVIVLMAVTGGLMLIMPAILQLANTLRSVAR